MARSTSAIQADIDAVRAAKTRLLAGSQVESFSVGAKSFNLAKITFADLQAEERELQQELFDSQNGASVILPTFPGDSRR